MKVLFLNYEYPPLGGGAGNATQYLLKEYAHIPDLEVHLVTSSADGAYHHFQVGNGAVTVHSVPIGKNSKTLHFQSIFDLLRYSWSGYRFGKKLLSQGDFDAIHAFFSVPCGVQACLLGRQFKIPYIVSLRGADVPGFSERFSLLYAFLRPLIRRVWRRAYAVVAASQGLKKLAHTTNASQKISVIGNGIDITEFAPAKVREVDGYIRILCVSRMTPRKGIRYLIQAMQIILRKDATRKLELWIVGEGDELQSLKRSATDLGVAKNVKFFGRVEHNKLLFYYQLADIFCLPSLNEGMSNALLEALASGLPLVATVTGGTEELVRDGENGFFIKQHSAVDIAEKLEILMRDEASRQRFSQASRERAEAMSWKNVAAEYHHLYQEATKK
jgi:glycosyltransferase involved in cell wall biosynthesis